MIGDQENNLTGHGQQPTSGVHLDRLADLKPLEEASLNRLPAAWGTTGMQLGQYWKMLVGTGSGVRYWEDTGQLLGSYCSHWEDTGTRGEQVCAPGCVMLLVFLVLLTLKAKAKRGRNELAQAHRYMPSERDHTSASQEQARKQ